MDVDTTTETKSITCSKLPIDLLADKLETKKFFSQFGRVKTLITNSSRQKCTVEYETVEAAQKALNADVNFEIRPTKPEFSKAEDFVDPDVQAELESMLPIGKPKQSFENIIKNPPTNLFKAKTFLTNKQKMEPLAVSVHIDPQFQTVKNELENIIKRPARTAEEKFAILDARDKLYRLMNAKPADIKKVTSTKGTCKDMCPEKERLMRVARYQVASFELDDERSQMDPAKAIKQYSRSSADQEIPLPHELRSENVLKTTMTYLLHNIINSCDDEDIATGDWYHFVWDRTRGIRKDITQQELCSTIGVELLEQCARFHIHCSARLIAEGPGVFDKKINDENLTKSLQTLKYMYDDLKLRNIKCPNEAEFRAYVVLLNLNESGNFLWQIKRLEKDLLNSNEVRFALDVYFAVAQNNYVKFFNLVRDASYMNACLLLRYFTQIRLKAIFTILRSYTSRRGATIIFNLSYLQEILAFEDFEATVNFMSFHSASCEADQDLVHLDQNTFGNTDVPYQMDRAFQIVESKLEGSVAEAICGGPLPSPDCYLNIKPHSSFDEDGYFKKEAFYAEDQNGPSPPSPYKESLFKIPRESPPVSPKNVFQQRPTVRNDQPDGSQGDNIFGKPSSIDNPFSLPKNKSTSSSDKNIFASQKIFGGFNEFANASASKPINIFASNNSLQTANFGNNELFKITKPETIASIASNIFAKPLSNTESPKTLFDSPKTSVLSSSPSSSPYSSSNSLFGSNNYDSSPKQGFSFQAFPQEHQEAILLKEQQKRDEEERIRKENEVEEERLRLKLEEKIRQEKERKEAERKRIEEEEKEKQELEVLRMRKLQEDAEKILDGMLDEIVKSKTSDESNIAVTLFVKIPQDFYNALEHDVVVEELFKIYNQELLGYINMTKRKYETLDKYFNEWRTTITKQISRRNKLSNIGCSILNQSDAILHPQQKAALSNMKQYLSGSPQQISLPNLDKFRVLNLFQEMKFSQTKIPEKLFWKMLISVPLKGEENCLGFSCFIKKWLRNSFGLKEEDKGTFYLKRGLIADLQRMMSICVRKIQGIAAFDENGESSNEIVKNSNSLIFLSTMTNLTVSRRRLQKIIDNVDNPISISIIIYKNIVEENDERLLEEHMNLTGDPKVKTFEINLFYECQEKSKDLTQIILESCQFLCDNYMHQLENEYSKLYELEMQHLLDFFQFCIGDEMWQRIELSCRDNKEFKKHMCSFNNVIQLYNCCIDKLIQIVSNDYHNLPSIADEFRPLLPTMEIRIPHNFEYFPSNWKSLLQQKNLISFLCDLKLEKMKDDKFKDFNDFKDKLMSFLSKNVQTHKDQVFNAVIEKMIHNFYLLQLQSETENLDQVIDKLKLLHIFGDIVVGRFNQVFQHRQKDLPSSVIYFKKDLTKYLIPWWYVANIFNNSFNEQSNEPRSKKPRTIQNVSSKDYSDVLQKGRNCIKKVNDIISSSRQNSMKTREDSKNFDQYLHKCEERLQGMKRTLNSIQDKPKE